LSIATDLRAAHDDLWEKTVRHRFVLDLGDGTLPRKVFRDYMVQDYLFIDKLVRLVAGAIAKAPLGADQRPLGAFLSTLLGAEDDLFKRVFAEMDVPWPMPSPPTPLSATDAPNSGLEALLCAHGHDALHH
jgi:thiaminase/transcriptional activator TenA